MKELDAGDRVVIIGAGPAGAATALALARNSIPVVLVDRSRFPRRKVCGEYLGAGAVAELDALGLGETVRAEGKALRGVRLTVPEVEPLELAFPQAALALSRERLDAFILDAAVRAGAQLMRARAEDILFDEDRRVRGIVIRSEDGERRDLRGRYLVGADGLSSVVARKLSLCRPVPRNARFAIGGHYRGLGDRSGFVEMHVGKNGYFATNPLTEDIANVMAVSRKDRLGIWSRILDRASGMRVGARVSIGPLAHRVSRIVVPGALLVGDASGFVDPFTGQGVYLALRGAGRAARAISHAFACPGEQMRAFAGYEAAIREELAARTTLANVVDVLLRFPVLGRRAARRLTGSSELRATMLQALSGGSPPGSALGVSFMRRLLL